ncbi:peptidase domain-containing ABC transporter [Vibrio anguillarum]|uniref:peptidase domain-containing ABC transporter n=1 Tax=Vibrio anguillarum TaxID=55601 RepID=UPI000304FF96|nr:type I secretion system permease/ATPase [Vibrio anguillarum]OEE42746.1 peptidase C39 [Vibrio anguillarum]
MTDLNEKKAMLHCLSVYLPLIGIREIKLDISNETPSNAIDSIIKDLKGRNYLVTANKVKSFTGITKIKKPIILFNKNNHPFILAKVEQDKCLIHPCDSDTPKVVDASYLKQNWNGKTLDIKKKQSSFDIRWFLPELSQHKHLIAEIVLFSFVLQVIALITPLFFQVVMDKVLVHQAHSTLDVLVFVLVISGIAEVLLRGLREYQYAHTANRIDIKLGIKLVHHLFGLPLLFFKSRQVGAIVTRVRELDTIREFITGSMFTLTIDLVFLVIFFYVMSLLSGGLTLLVLATLPCYLFLAWWLTPRLQQAIEQQFTHMAHNTSFLTETVAGSDTIKSLATEPRFIRRWDTQTEQMISSNYVVQQWNNRSSHAVQFIQKIASVFLLWIGASEVLALQMTIGQLIAFNMLASHVAQTLARLVELWGQFIQAQIAVDKLSDLLNLPTEQQQASNPLQLQGAITLNQVSFRYQPDLPLTINQLSLNIQAGEKIGVVGGSGSGKSTLARLLLKLYSPESGQIMFDNTSLKQIGVHELRRQLGVVSQENFLFSKSVSDNIAHSKPQASLDEIVHAAKLAGAHEFILKLPLGYDTILAEGGQSLSGGQRQRLAIARTLLADPKILILDEATSALDDESQAIIQTNMEQIAAGRTVITIAHRLSTVRECDRIIVLEKGEIAEQGTHLQLLAEQGKYFQLWQLQRALKQEDERV